MASILIAEDNEGLRKALREQLQKDKHEVVETKDGDEALAALQGRHFDLLVTDIRMPGMDGLELLKRVKAADPETIVILMTAYGTVEKAVEAMKEGAFDFITKPFPMHVLSLTIKKSLDRQKLLRDNLMLRQNLSSHYDPAKMIWESSRMAEVMDLVKKVAATSSTVLVVGESGVGKELVAHAVHAQSDRAGQALVKVNCAVFAEGVLESELFGHEKGSFTGAHARKQGRFELADGGTIFLDEVGDMPPVVQVKLLRVLQEREFERVGGTVPVKVNVRVIAATKYDLRELVSMLKFREDLFYRLNVMTIKIPPLRERRDDIPALARHFLQRYRADSRKEVTDIKEEALEALMSYSWPGNVRELENVIQRGLVLAEGNLLERRDLPADVRMGVESGIAGPELAKAREEQEKAAIIEALKIEGENRSRAAARLNLNRTTLLYKMKKYGLGQ